MIKEVPCMDCDGKGFIAKFSEYSMWSERCPNCGGTGIVKVPMTNADRIRAMSDEELAKFLCNFRSCDSSKHPCNGCKAEPHCHTGHNGMIDWLQQPAEEDT